MNTKDTQAAEQAKNSQAAKPEAAPNVDSTIKTDPSAVDMPTKEDIQKFINEKVKQAVDPTIDKLEEALVNLMNMSRDKDKKDKDKQESDDKDRGKAIFSV